MGPLLENVTRVQAKTGFLVLSFIRNLDLGFPSELIFHTPSHLNATGEGGTGAIAYSSCISAVLG